jgi:hypothetical protein
MGNNALHMENLDALQHSNAIHTLNGVERYTKKEDFPAYYQYFREKAKF